MVSAWKWRLVQQLGEIGVTVAVFGLIAVVAALGSVLAAPMIPDWAAERFGGDSVQTILEILASSMLAVTTFSVSIMVTAFGSAASGATPRALGLLQRDPTTQRVLAIFIGAFVYALVGIIAMESGYYGRAGRVVLFAVSVAVVAVVIIALIRWVQHLTRFGLLADTIGRVERAARAALVARSERPHLGAAPWCDPPGGSWPVMSSHTGQVQHVDLGALQDLAARGGCRIWVEAEPGAFVHPAAVLARCDALPASAEARAALAEAIGAAFALGHGRSYDQDPRFGLIALAEIAQRALSPAVNDPGTALDILSRLARVLADWRPAEAAPTARPAEAPRFGAVHLRALCPEDLLRDAFDAVARDGAGVIEVMVRLQQILQALAALPPGHFAPAAAGRAARAARLAQAALPLEEDRARIAAMAAALGGTTAAAPQPDAG